MDVRSLVVTAPRLKAQQKVRHRHGRRGARGGQKGSSLKSLYKFSIFFQKSISEYLFRLFEKKYSSSFSVRKTIFFPTNPYSKKLLFSDILHTPSDRSLTPTVVDHSTITTRTVNGKGSVQSQFFNRWRKFPL